MPSKDYSAGGRGRGRRRQMRQFLFGATEATSRRTMFALSTSNGERSAHREGARARECKGDIRLLTTVNSFQKVIHLRRTAGRRRFLELGSLKVKLRIQREKSKTTRKGRIVTKWRKLLLQQHCHRGGGRAEVRG